MHVGVCQHLNKDLRALLHYAHIDLSAGWQTLQRAATFCPHALPAAGWCAAAALNLPVLLDVTVNRNLLDPL